MASSVENDTIITSKEASANKNGRLRKKQA